MEVLEVNWDVLGRIEEWIITIMSNKCAYGCK